MLARPRKVPCRGRILWVRLGEVHPLCLPAFMLRSSRFCSEGALMSRSHTLSTRPFDHCLYCVLTWPQSASASCLETEMKDMLLYMEYLNCNPPSNTAAPTYGTGKLSRMYNRWSERTLRLNARPSAQGPGHPSDFWLGMETSHVAWLGHIYP